MFRLICCVSGLRVWPPLQSIRFVPHHALLAMEKKQGLEMRCTCTEISARVSVKADQLSSAAALPRRLWIDTGGGEVTPETTS